MSSLEKDVKTYYEGTLLSNVKIWNEVAKKASNDFKSLPNDVAEKDSTANDDVSEDFERRLERAEKLAMQQYRDMIRQEERDSRIEARKKDMAAQRAYSNEENEDDDRDEDEDYDDDVPEFEEIQ